MESPLDILSRAAGMVSRSSKDYENSDCRILKLALVRNNNNNNNNKNSANLEPTFQKSTNNKDNQLIDDLDDKPLEPIDMSINKLNSQMHTLKRKLDSSNEGGRSVIVHKRPSVITYADVHEDIVQCDIVDEHFKRALGIQSYNEVFKGEKKSKVELCDSTKQPPEPSEDVGVKSIKTVDKSNKEDKLKKAVSPQTNSNVQQSSNHELSVDDHFAKALGKSTWMRLQKLDNK